MEIITTVTIREVFEASTGVVLGRMKGVVTAQEAKKWKSIK